VADRAPGEPAGAGNGGGDGQGCVTCAECTSAPSLIVDEKNVTTSLAPVASSPDAVPEEQAARMSGLDVGERCGVVVERAVQVLLLPRRATVVRVPHPDVGRRDAVSQDVVPVVVVRDHQGSVGGHLHGVVVGLHPRTAGGDLDLSRAHLRWAASNAGALRHPGAKEPLLPRLGDTAGVDPGTGTRSPRTLDS